VRTGAVDHRAKFDRGILDGCRDIAILNFQNGGRPPFWISENLNF